MEELNMNKGAENKMEYQKQDGGTEYKEGTKNKMEYQKTRWRN